jgi:hypothetical protein
VAVPGNYNQGTISTREDQCLEIIIREPFLREKINEGLGSFSSFTTKMLEDWPVSSPNPPF